MSKRIINQWRLKATGELATWDAYDYAQGGLRVLSHGDDGAVEFAVSNGTSGQHVVLTAAEVESLRQWLNMRHEEAPND